MSQATVLEQADTGELITLVTIVEKQLSDSVANGQRAAQQLPDRAQLRASHNAKSEALIEELTLVYAEIAVRQAANDPQAICFGHVDARSTTQQASA